ncbi:MULTISPECIES: Na+/H+ antiporter NhaA [Microbacterium]|uniref:Na+/H+ antiporter NhaA n=1 Tax=Microbacterium TaxID=33882 RepID=UPI0027862B6F|nr:MULTISPECIES: Na+/H+ antiporter NhaA [Microbacterium]MDQ1082623.1 NhaA family Na+:H+ antiporter [Microbacterium sp. SORGH_AS_0344]MDQ1168606.1 NhaA family Na+:H+ antiporter [Microbacterium proteolyticum]
MSPDTVRAPSWPGYAEVHRVTTLLRRESVGGMLLVSAAIAAIVWANSPASDAYFALRDVRFGFASWHLELSVGAWAADGLLAVFFFLVGLELKREMVAGSLRRFDTAIVPVTAAFAGVAVPALIYVAVVHTQPSLLAGWAIPTATDIAFAVAVLALVGSHLPGPLRIFLLTLAVVDDLIAIAIIAIFYTSDISLLPLAVFIVLVGVYGVIAHRGRAWFARTPWGAWVVLLPIGFAAWAFLHASGVHATIAGVALAFTVPVAASRRRPQTRGMDLAEQFEHRFRPLSAGIAVPIFAFFAAGVSVGGGDGLLRALADPVTIGVVAGLVLGKPLGILLGVRLLTLVTRVRLDPALKWIDLAGVGLLAGIGFTVSLLIAELSFPAGSPHTDDAKIAIMVASLVASLLASAVLLVRNRRYKQLALAEEVDADGDGVPDVYQQPVDRDR